MTSKRPRASSTRSRNAGSRSPKRHAPRRRPCGTATGRPPIRFRRVRASSSRRVQRSGRPTSSASSALIERAEALADSTDWIKTADELKKLQHEWQLIGAVPRNDTRATWKRFRDACDKFFTRRNADLAERKETWSANLAKKEALCARAEELAASREWDRAASEIRRLQIRVEDGRTRAPEQVGGHLAALPHGLRHVLRTLQAPRRNRSRSQAGRSRGAPRRAGVPRTAVRGRHAGTDPFRSTRARAVAPYPLEPDVLRRTAGRGSLERTICGCARARDADPSGPVPRHRARRGRQPAEDGEADRKSGGLPVRRGSGSEQLVAGPRRHAARGARLEHDRRARQRRSPLARDGRRRSSGASVLEPPWSGARGRPAASSPNASTARATASTTSIDAGSRRSSRPAGAGRNCRRGKSASSFSFQRAWRRSRLTAGTCAPLLRSLISDLPANDRVDHLGRRNLVLGDLQDVLREHDDVRVLAGLQRAA